LTARPGSPNEAVFMDSTTIAPARIVELGYSFQAAKALLSAVELDVFTVLAEGPLDVESLSQRTGIIPRGAGDFFDTLVAIGLLDRDHEGRYANTPETDRYLDRRKPSYVGALLEILNTRHFGAWTSLTPALQGNTQVAAGASGHYPALYTDRTALEAFAKGMTGATRLVGAVVVEKFPWQDYRTVIDVGTAEGCLPVQIAQAYPQISASGFDLPALKPLFDDYVAERGLSSRLRFHAGDFFHDPLPTADVLVMGRILHNWDLAAKKMLLKKAYDALPPGGALIVYDRLVDDERRTNATALLMSLHMLIMTSGGFAFTAAECLDWMHEAGFHDMRVEPLALSYSMVVGIKKR
jgi:hypothetical protein